MLKAAIFMKNGGLVFQDGMDGNRGINATYHLIDIWDLRLQDGNSITNGWFLVQLGGGSEGSATEVGNVLLLGKPWD